MASDDRAPPRAVGVELIQDLSAISPALSGFLRRHRHRIKTKLSDGTRTDTYVVDYVDRAPNRRDAVGAIAFIRDEDPLRTTVLLREQVRYPPYVVSGQATMIECVAGIIEGDEPPEAAALRELYEEAGIRAAPTAARQVGGWFYPSPGILTERITIVAIELDADALDGPLAPPGDGSEMEVGAELLSMSLGDALALADRGGTDDPYQIQDAKTELALFRLKRMLESEA
ncbi:MAG: NUDIX hydrolase [Deltaproteobacteria bacterium]